MRTSILGLLLLASCATETAIQRESREAFESYIQAAVEGDPVKTFTLLSDTFKSEWVFQRLEVGDGPARRWRGELQGQARTDLDLWWEYCKKHRENRPRADRLPVSVLAHPSLPALWNEYFQADRNAYRVRFSGMQVMEVYPGDGGVTLTARNGEGRTEMFGLIAETEGWKIDNHKPPKGAPAPR